MFWEDYDKRSSEDSKNFSLEKQKIQNNVNNLFRRGKISDVTGVMNKRVDIYDNFFFPWK